MEYDVTIDRAEILNRLSTIMNNGLKTYLGLHFEFIEERG